MPTAELTYPTSLWDLMGDDTDRDAVVLTMTRSLPPQGITSEAMPRRFRLASATFRVLDSRILRAALSSLETDVAEPLVKGLAAYQRVTDAARETLPPASQEEVTAVLVQPRRLPWTHDFEVVVTVDRQPVATVAFHLAVTLELGETSVVVREAAVDRVTCDAASATASLSYEGWPQPLWSPEPRTLPVDLVVRPPLPVPVQESATAVPGPRRAEPRPPVPAPGTGSRG